MTKLSTKKIIIASQNPVKINATQKAFVAAFADPQVFEGISVPSGVSDQPMSDEETLKGARNRTNAAKAAFPDADFWVGLEGGVEELPSGMYAFAWIVVQSNTQVGQAKSSYLPLAPIIAQRLQRGEELGPVNDAVFGQKDSKKAGGAAGLLTNNILSREKIYTDTVILALIPFLQPELYTR
ncbi:MAG: inosine/xanthosine triphosphatase [Saprospiraceae bacterium]